MNGLLGGLFLTSSNDTAITSQTLPHITNSFNTDAGKTKNQHAYFSVNKQSA